MSLTPLVVSVSVHPAVPRCFSSTVHKHENTVKQKGEGFGWDKFVCSSLPLGGPKGAHYSPFSYQSSEGHFGHQNSLFKPEPQPAVQPANVTISPKEVEEAADWKYNLLITPFLINKFADKTTNN